MNRTITGHLSRYENIIFEKANEYTVVLADLLLRLTDKDVFFLDERAGWFFADHDRLHLGTEPSDGRSDMRVYESKVPIDLFSEHGGDDFHFSVLGGLSAPMALR